MPSGTGAGRQVTVRVKNTGARAGAEVVQLYVGLPAAAAEPPRLLKGFQKVMLQPGESRALSMDLPDASLEVFDASRKEWTRVAGSYRVLVGASSRDIRQEGTFDIGR